MSVDGVVVGVGSWEETLLDNGCFAGSICRGVTNCRTDVSRCSVGVLGNVNEFGGKVGIVWKAKEVTVFGASFKGGPGTSKSLWGEEAVVG